MAEEWAFGKNKHIAKGSQFQRHSQLPSFVLELPFTVLLLRSDVLTIIYREERTSILAIFVYSIQFKACSYIFILAAFEECNDRWCCCSKEQMRYSFKLLSLDAEYRYVMVLSSGI